ncbi:MAG: hypothetical protein M0011_12505 [Elusimicrobia bacterium]|nr:hypothetical protein [Elusimicrobiota bacterium]
MAKAAGQSHLGIYISPKEICISQVKIGKASKPEVEHLVKFPTNFPVKEGMLRPLSLNHEFFNEKAPWLDSFKQAVKRVSWGSSSAVVTLSQHFSILRYFVMPAVDRRFWSKSIPLESKKYIPVSFDEVVYDYCAVPSDGGKKLGVLFGLTQRKSVEFLTETLKSAGLTLAAVEATPLSLERASGFLDSEGHDSKGYVHFSENSSYMVFSHSGYPVLYRETETDSGGTMSERKRLDIKGAVQFVDRYVGGKDYKAVMLSGDGCDVWQGSVAKEAAPIPVETWNISALMGLKDNDAAALFASAAAMKGRVPGPSLPDISGVSTAANLEKKVQSYVWNITFLLGGILLLFSILGQTRLFMASSKVSSLRNKVLNVPELDGLDPDTIKSKITTMQTGGQVLQGLVSDVDPFAPKMSAIADLIPAELWVTGFSYSNPFSLSEAQSAEREFRISGETFLKGQSKSRLVDAFTSAVKKSEAFKAFTPPFGAVDSTTEEGGVDSPFANDPGHRPTTSFAVVCRLKRK